MTRSLRTVYICVLCVGAVVAKYRNPSSSQSSERRPDAFWRRPQQSGRSPNMQTQTQRHGQTIRTTLGTLILKAHAFVRREEEALQLRLQRGLDVDVRSTATLTPGLLGAGIGTLNKYVIPSSKINTLATMIRSLPGDRVMLSQALAHPLARRLGFICPFRQPSCTTQSRYRSVDGTCNNLENPLWGSSFTPLRRIMKAVYEQELKSHVTADLPRATGKHGRPLPSARAVSVAVHTSDDNTPLDQYVTNMYTVFGQFVAHDITNTPMSHGFNGTMLSCCQTSISTSRCSPITILNDDPFYSRYGRNCLPFARSAQVTDVHCTTGQREQLNKVSSFLDATGIYGNTKTYLGSLRKHTGGLLKMSVPNLFPVMSHPNHLCAELGVNMYKAGDEKVNVFAGLSSLTLAWLRQHNMVASSLAEVNPHWQDERLFQEARRIVIAILQHIVYKEYLPITIGPAFVNYYDLLPKHDIYDSGYNSNINPSMMNVVATAAERFGHSMVKGAYPMPDVDCQPTGTSINLKDMYFRSNFFTMNVKPVMRNLVCYPSAGCDRHLTSHLTSHMFQTQAGNGLDLAAANIQRGRDHGLASYNMWRKLVGLSEVTQWAVNQHGFVDHDQVVVDRLRSIYDDVDDVDVWTGGVSEKPVLRGLVGPLFANLLALQFKRLKHGDRFWYETDQHPQRFTLAQLNDIRQKASLSRVLCDSGDVVKIQTNAMHMPSLPGNDVVPCSSFLEIDWTLWRE